MMTTNTAPPAHRTLRYGMRFRTIRYWQQRARRLRLTHDIRVGESTLRHVTERTPPISIAYDAIGLAAVATPAYVRLVLQGGAR